jgi:N-acetylglutamate synthase-like GNAT family acetyltransferase
VRTLVKDWGKGLKVCAVLELLAVHPDYQCLGAGTALVAFGTGVADEAGIKVCILAPSA